MTIGIIVHSKTGHTLLVAEQLRDKLLSSGHDTVLIRIEDRPAFDRFDTLVLGSHTEGFALAPEMASYLKSLPENALDRKKTALLITHAFPFHAMGGNQAMWGFKILAQNLGAFIASEEIIDWSNPGRNRQIENAVIRMAESLQ